MVGKLIFLLLLYLLYRTARSWYLDTFSDRTKGDGGDSRETPADLMVQDPHCKVYFPRREGVHLKIEGDDTYFCSEACRDKYLLAQKQRKQE